MTTAMAFRTRGIAVALTLILALGGAAVIGGCADDPGGRQNIESPVDGDIDGDGITDYGGGNNYKPAPVPDLN